MESNNINLRDLSKIPEKEFKQHFRNWVEQDDIARSLQAKLRKDLISNFNKTSLGKKIIAQAAVSHRLTLSPLILALNTLVAEFLYAQNCHFTLSVFCTEVPYRNILPDFEGGRHFRFSEREIFEIFDVLCGSWGNNEKEIMLKEYSKEKNYSLLFVVLRNLLNKPKDCDVREEQPQKVEPMPEQPEKPQKPESKIDHQSNNFRYLNKYLIILSKKVKDMSQNLEILQKQRTGPEKKTLHARKFENLNRSLEKISENLRQMSVKRKNKRLTAVINAVDVMAKQFERCALNFDQINKGYRGSASAEKTYNDWIKEMRTTDNGKIFLERIESSLRKTLHREREKMERELEQRLQIQKDILKTKYKQKLTEELTKYTSRGNAENTQRVNESLEKKLKEFETKHQELHQRIHEAEKRVMETPPQKADTIIPILPNKGTQTSTDAHTKPNEIPVDTKDELQQMVKTISEQERQVDHIVFDAKLRIQELEHESNQLDRSFCNYLERQRAEKQKMRENATSIWQSYALGKSMLDKKCATLRSTTMAMSKHPATATTPIVVFKDKPPKLSIPTIHIDTSVPASPPAFENPFRAAQRKVLARSKTLPPPRPSSTDTKLSTEKHTRHPSQQQPSVCRLIEHNEADDEKIFQPPPSATPELNITLDGAEIIPTTAKSSSLRSGESNGSSSSPRGVFKLRRQLFTANTDNECPSSSNGNKEAEELLWQTNKENGGDRKKFVDSRSMGVNRDIKGARDENRSSEELTGGTSANNLDAGVEEDVSSQSSRLDISTGGSKAQKESDNDFWG